MGCVRVLHDDSGGGATCYMAPFYMMPCGTGEGLVIRVRTRFRGAFRGTHHLGKEVTKNAYTRP